MKLGMIFPGQGSQFVGMAKSFYDNERLIQEFFEEASNCLNQNFVKLCFASSEKELTDTINAQTSIFLVSTAVASLLKERDIIPDVIAGHGCGQYSAMFIAGGFNFPDGLYLLKKRCQFLDEATADQDGGMLAVTNFPELYLREIIVKYDRPQSDNAIAEIVVFNTPNNFVVSGTMNELNAVKAEIENQGGKASFLKVSGAFNSRLMHEVQKKFALYLEKVDFQDLSIDLVENSQAKIIKSANEVKTSLIDQIISPILWWESMKYFVDCDVIVEVAPGIKLSKMLNKEWPSKNIISINEPSDIEQLESLIKITSF